MYLHVKENQRNPYHASWSGAIINPHWLELLLSRTNFHGPKGVRAIEVRLYIVQRKESALDSDNNVIKQLKPIYYLNRIRLSQTNYMQMRMSISGF